MNRDRRLTYCRCRSRRKPYVLGAARFAGVCSSARTRAFTRAQAHSFLLWLNFRIQPRLYPVIARNSPKTPASVAQKWRRMGDTSRTSQGIAFGTVFA